MRLLILYPLFVAPSLAAPPDLSNLPRLTDAYNKEQEQRFVKYPDRRPAVDEHRDAVVFVGWLGNGLVTAFADAETNIIAYLEADEVWDENYRPIKNHPSVITFTLHTYEDDDEISVPASVEGRLVDKAPVDRGLDSEGKAYVVAFPISNRNPKKPFACSSTVHFKPVIDNVPTVDTFSRVDVNWIYPDTAIPETTVWELDDQHFSEDFDAEVLCYRPKKVRVVVEKLAKGTCVKLAMRDGDDRDAALQDVALTNDGEGRGGTFIAPNGTAVEIVCTTASNKKRNAFLDWQT